MRDCDTRELAISAMLDGQAEPREMLAAMDHIVTCGDCRDFYRKARALDRRLEEVRTATAARPLPGDLWVRIATAAALSPPARERRFIRIARGAALAAAILVLALVLPQWLGKASPGSLESAGVEVVLESNRGGMTDQRFVMLAKELLESDRRYHQQLYRIMDDLRATWPDLDSEEFSEEEVPEEMRIREQPPALAVRS